MQFMARIIEALNGAGAWFYQLYLLAYYAGWPLSSIADLFYALSQSSYNLAWRFYEFSTWVADVQGRLASILSLAQIQSHFSSIFAAAQNAWAWVVNAPANLWSLVNSWWSSAQLTVKVWIDEAIRTILMQVASLSTTLMQLKTVWDSFAAKLPGLDAILAWWRDWWGAVLANLNTWWASRLLEVQELINSAFTARQSLWAGWQDLRAKVNDFFTDPVEYIWQRFTDWFLGPEV